MPQHAGVIEIHDTAEISEDTVLNVTHECSRIVIGPGARIRGQFDLLARRTSLHIGARTKCNGYVRMILAEIGDRIDIGEDCLFSSCKFRTSDGHPIYSKSTGKRVNPSADIWIGDGVWIGDGATILKGVRIGGGSVVGAGALVTRRREAWPGSAVISGNPAEIVATDIEWRDRFGDDTV